MTSQDRVLDLKKLEKIVIVSHSGPDDDSCISTYLLIKALGIRFNDPRLFLVFVPKGDRLDPQTEEEEVLVKQGIDNGTLAIFHIDTGKITDPEKGDFDHHDNLNFHCSAEVIADHFWEGKDRIPEQDEEVKILTEQKKRVAYDQELKSLVELAVFRDTASEVGSEDEKTAQIRAHSNHILRQAHIRGATNVRLITIAMRPGPKDLSTYLHNKRGSDEDVMRGGLDLIQTWVDGEKKDKKIELFLEHSSQTLEIQRANVLVVSHCTKFRSGDIRHYVRTRHQHGDNVIHLIIAEYFDPSKSFEQGERVINLTIVHNRSKIEGVSTLYQALYALERKSTKKGIKSKDPFLHHSGNIMNFTDPSFTLDRVVELAKQHVQMPERRTAESN